MSKVFDRPITISKIDEITDAEYKKTLAEQEADVKKALGDTNV